jgi:hypothetical protein
MSEIPNKPELILDEGMDPSVRSDVRALDRVIGLNPALAENIISLYSRDIDAGDSWIAVFSGEKGGTSYPFRLTAALGSTASRETMRYITFDSATDKAIDSDPKMKEAIQRVQAAPSKEDREKASKKVGLLRLGKYAGRLAAYNAQETPVRTDQETSATA